MQGKLLTPKGPKRKSGKRSHNLTKIRSHHHSLQNCSESPRSAHSRPLATHKKQKLSTGRHFSSAEADGFSSCSLTWLISMGPTTALPSSWGLKQQFWEVQQTPGAPSHQLLHSMDRGQHREGNQHPRWARLPCAALQHQAGKNSLGTFPLQYPQALPSWFQLSWVFVAIHFPTKLGFPSLCSETHAPLLWGLWQDQALQWYMAIHDLSLVVGQRHDHKWVAPKEVRG